MASSNQQISGRRTLNEGDLSLINQVKAYEAQGHALLQQIGQHIAMTENTLPNGPQRNAFIAAEPQRWLAMGRTHLQEGCMCIIRSVARPQPSGEVE